MIRAFSQQIQVSESPFFRTNKKSVAFREWLKKIDAEVIELLEGAFKERGTMARIWIIKAHKP